MAETEAQQFIRDGSGPLADLALTLPLFLGYHLGVVLLPTRNAADLLTHELVTLAHNDLWSYAGITLAIGVTFAAVLLVLGRRDHLKWQRFLLVGFEGIVYAVAMRVLAGYVVGKLHLAGANLPEILHSTFAGTVMSLGAGFYEELVFRVGLFGVGSRLVLALFGASSHARRLGVSLAWAALVAGAFSAWHYIGDYGDPFDARSFVFRWVCGLAFTAIFAFRGFAPVVWTHTLYDLWVMVL
jgi:hypothetical protein